MPPRVVKLGSKEILIKCTLLRHAITLCGRNGVFEGNVHAASRSPNKFAGGIVNNVRSNTKGDCFPYFPQCRLKYVHARYF